MLTQTSRTKLDLIRLEGICKLILDKVDNRELKHRVESILNGEIKDIKKAIYRLARFQLLLIISNSSEIIDTDIDLCYEQYRYGLKPGFTLFAFIGECNKIGYVELSTAIKEYISKLKYSEEDNLKNVSLKSFVETEEDVCEFSFTYLSKYTYITEEDKPTFIYELNECFVWISIKERFMAIKNAPDRINTILKRAIVSILGISVNNLKLTKKLVHDLFGQNSIHKGTYHKPNADNHQAQKVTIADANLADKQSVLDQYNEYDLSGTYLTEKIDENTIGTLGINCNKGKLHITRNVDATIFRKWSIRTIKGIIDYLKLSESGYEFDVFKAKNVTDDVMWNSYKGKAKKYVEKLIYYSAMYFSQNKELALLEFSSTEIIESLYNDFHIHLSFECDKCDEETLSFCAECSSSNLMISRNGDLICGNCGSVSRAPYKLLCEEGHESEFINLGSIIKLTPKQGLIKLIERTLHIYELTKKEFKDFTFEITESTIIFRDIAADETMIVPKQILEFEQILSIPISPTIYDKNIQQFLSMKEKCNDASNAECNSCYLALTPKNECMMRLFTVFGGFRPSPHQGHEFGDVCLQVSYNGQKHTLVGLAKSRPKKVDNITLSSDVGREILQQFVSAAHDSRIDIVALICPIRFNDQLIEELRYISKYSQKKIMLLDDYFMVPLLESYRNNKVGNSVTVSSASASIITV